MEIDFVMLDRLKFYCWIFTKKKKKQQKKQKKQKKMSHNLLSNGDLYLGVVVKRNKILKKKVFSSVF